MKKKFDDNPRALAQMVFLFLLCAWQLLPAVVAILLFGLLARVFRIDWKYVVGGGVIIAIVSALIIVALPGDITLQNYFAVGWAYNAQYIKWIFHGYAWEALKGYCTDARIYLLTATFPAVAMFTLMEFIPNGSTPHEDKLRALWRGQSSRDTFAPIKPTKIAQIRKSLDDLNDRDYDGTLLGLPANSNKPCVMPDEHVNQLALVLGTTGSGKTVTLQRFYRRAMLARYPLIIVDGKPTDKSTAWIKHQALLAGKPFYSFNCENFWHYDPLAHGGYTELKDKIISLKDEWESDYYRSIAEDYLQTTFEILQASGKPYNLKRVVECLDYSELASVVREIKNPVLEARAKRIGQYERKDITGLQAHLNLLIHSELGKYFEQKEDQTFNLADVIQNNAVVYFALPALRFPSFSKVLGKLIINDIKAVIDREHSGKRIFTVFDEFSVFAGEQVLNLVNMGRGKGVHAIFGTQGLSDLKRVDAEFAAQVLNCVNTIICHRLNDHESAESIAAWAGTRDMFDVTAQIGGDGATGMGSVRRNKEFIIHPDVIKQDLQNGEAILISKAGQFRSERIKVKLS